KGRSFAWFAFASTLVPRSVPSADDRLVDRELGVRVDDLVPGVASRDHGLEEKEIRAPARRSPVTGRFPDPGGAGDAPRRPLEEREGPAPGSSGRAHREAPGRRPPRCAWASRSRAPRSRGE